jgi:hypothetical protein
MRQLRATADLYDVNGVPMLIAHATPELIDTLAAFEAEAEDRENDLCDGPSEDLENDRNSDYALSFSLNDGGVVIIEDGDGEPEATQPLDGARKPMEAFRADPERKHTLGQFALNTCQEVRRLQRQLPGVALNVNRRRW